MVFNLDKCVSHLVSSGKLGFENDLVIEPIPKVIENEHSDSDNFISQLVAKDKLRNKKRFPNFKYLETSPKDKYSRDVVLQACLDGTLDCKEAYEKVEWDTPALSVNELIDRAISEDLLDEKEASEKVTWDTPEKEFDLHLDNLVNQYKQEATISNIEKTAIVKRPQRKGFFSRIGNKIAAGIAVVATVAGISYSAMEKNDYQEKPKITMQENVNEMILPKSESLETISSNLDRKDQVYNMLSDSYYSGKGKSKFSKYNVYGFMLNQNVINIILKDWFKSPKAYTIYTNANDYAKAELGINLHELTKNRGEVFDSEKRINF